MTTSTDPAASARLFGTVTVVNRTVAHDPAEQAVLIEMQALVRKHEGLIHQLRLERLGVQAAAGTGVAVRHSWSGWCGDRMTLELDDGRLVKLHLFWPRRQAVAAVLGVRWTDRTGWMITVRTTAGEQVIVYAWRGRVLLPRGAAHAPVGWSLLG